MGESLYDQIGGAAAVDAAVDLFYDKVMSDDTINACMADQAKATALVAEYQKNATADGVNSTPTFLVNGENVGNPGLDGLRELIGAELDG